MLGDSAAIHYSKDTVNWYDEPLVRDASTGCYAPHSPMLVGEYEGILRIKHARDGKELWMPIPLEGLREGRGGHNNRCWTIAPAE